MFETTDSSCTGGSSENIYVAAVEALKKNERQDETQFTTKIGGKLVWIPVILFGKIFIPGYLFDALLCPNWPFLL
jgi:hypothetical protein